MWEWIEKGWENINNPAGPAGLDHSGWYYLLLGIGIVFITLALLYVFIKLINYILIKEKAPDVSAKKSTEPILENDIPVVIATALAIHQDKTKITYIQPVTLTTVDTAWAKQGRERAVQRLNTNIN